jgi:GPH family glycoside/pentoside/hexuronide:cation symporter
MKPSASGAPERIPLVVAAGWGIGSFSAATMYQASTVFLLHYLVDSVGFAAVTAGLLLSAVKLYDAFIDPLVGTLSDRTHSRWGRRRPYILAGGLLSALSFVMLFNLPSVEGGAAMAAYAILVLLLNTTGYALLTIPYLAMPAEMTEDPRQRTYIVSYRVAGLAMGQISGATCASLLIGAMGGGAAGHSLMAWVMGAVIAGAAYACFAMTARAPSIPHPPAPRLSPWAKIRSALSNKPFALLLLVKMANLTGVHFFFALLPFLFVSVLDLGYGALGFFFAFQAVGMFGSQPLWVRVARLIGKKNLYFLGAALWAVGTAVWAYVDPQGNMAVVAGMAFALGIAAGSLLLAGQAMLPDAIAADFEKTGLRREGLFAGVYTTVEKVSGAGAAVLIGGLLTAAGYVGAHAAGGAATQTDGAMAAIKLMALAPGAFQILSAIPLLFYKISDRPPTITAAAASPAKA